MSRGRTSSANGPPEAARGMPTVWTVGHSTRTVEELIELLRAQRIERLVDVRSLPRSRRNPQFDFETLPRVLARAGIGHRHEPGLGGLRSPRQDSPNTGWRNAGFRGYADHMRTDAFEASLDALVAAARRERVVVMCAEAVPWRCHRSLLADALALRGIGVIHILGPGRIQPHRPTPFLRERDGRPLYPGLL